jgi:hypothetical protein
LVTTAQLFIYNSYTFPMMEVRMFGNSIQGGVAEPSFLYLTMAAAYFRQASRTRHPYVRDALGGTGRYNLARRDRHGAGNRRFA